MPTSEGSRMRSTGQNEIKFELQKFEWCAWHLLDKKKKLVQSSPKACVESWLGGKGCMDVALGATNVKIKISGFLIAQYVLYRGI